MNKRSVSQKTMRSSKTTLPNKFEETAGPGAYEIPNLIGSRSQLFKNPPRTSIPKNQLNPSLHYSRHLDTYLLGKETPGVWTYKPNFNKIKPEKNTHKIGTGPARNHEFISSLSSRSPGPIYYTLSKQKAKLGQFDKAEKTGPPKNVTPPPGYYNTNIKQATIAYSFYRSTLKATKEKETPSPNKYNTNRERPSTGSYISRTGRKSKSKNETAKISPGPADYTIETPYKIKSGTFSSSKIRLDPRTCKVYTDSQSKEMFKEWEMDQKLVKAFKKFEHEESPTNFKEKIFLVENEDVGQAERAEDYWIARSCNLTAEEAELAIEIKGLLVSNPESLLQRLDKLNKVPPQKHKRKRRKDEQKLLKKPKF